TPVCRPSWVGAWHASPSLYTGRLAGPLSMDPQADDGAVPSLSGRTVRMVVTPHASGSSLRITMSNRYGASPLRLGLVTVGHQAEGASVVGSTMRPVTFGGRTTASVPAGGQLRSDPVTLGAIAGRPLAITVFVRSADTSVTRHVDTRRTSYVSDANTAADPAAAPFTTATQSTFYLTGLDVLAPTRVNTVAVVGDSITDGTGTTLDADRRWTDFLQGRLDTSAPTQRMSVVNAAISGNQLMTDRVFFHGSSALSRLSWDLAPIAGLTDVILHEGTNDIALRTPARGAASIIAGMRRFAAAAHGLGLRAHITTITPTTFQNHGTPRAVAIRNAVNNWIRSQGTQVFDGVFDLAAAVSHPGNAAALYPDYDSGDQLHISDAGQAQLANAVDINALTGSRCR
ncbi:MAG: SGNH/GDSL hydrolase family protein, partial [Actinobacteria bacterium]|nr:SGNH/GDSL hydrolase family protein [Actinomycetota bacterium]